MLHKYVCYCSWPDVFCINHTDVSLLVTQVSYNIPLDSFLCGEDHRFTSGVNLKSFSLSCFELAYFHLMLLNEYQHECFVQKSICLANLFSHSRGIEAI